MICTRCLNTPLSFSQSLFDRHKMMQCSVNCRENVLLCGVRRHRGQRPGSAADPRGLAPQTAPSGADVCPQFHARSTRPRRNREIDVGARADALAALCSADKLIRALWGCRDTSSTNKPPTPPKKKTRTITYGPE